MARKFALIPYMYSYLFDIARFGGTLHRPLFFEYQEDLSAYANSTSENFMLGESIKVSISYNISIEYKELTSYFPAGTWCEILRVLPANESETCFTVPKGGSMMKLSDPLDSNNKFFLHLREGQMIALQDVDLSNKTRLTRTVEDMSN